MGEFERFCIKCGGFTLHRIGYDYDSDPDEPIFPEECLRCLGENDQITKVLPEGQEKLQL